MVATSFADASDLLAYNRALHDGRTPQEALAVGDNGLGAWNRSTVKGTGPCFALHPSVEGFRPGRLARITYGEKYVDADLRDIAPKNVIDLNPDTCEALGLRAPVKVMVDWSWL